MRHSFKRFAIIGNALTLSMLLILSACNEDSDLETYADPATLNVTAFSLKMDYQNVGVDSVYFAIDLNHGVIYNPDSLRPGTQINKLVPVIKYHDDVESATITMTGGSTRTGEVNYKDNPTDSIDFTGRVTLTLTLEDHSKTYDIKVNVHKEYADSLRWDEAARTVLPSRMPNPKAQKTIQLADSTALSLIQENDGSYTFAYSRDLYNNKWSNREISFPFSPDIKTLASAGDYIYILTTDGQLYQGDLSGNWTATSTVWQTMIGGYTNSVIGLRQQDGNLYFDQYPKATDGSGIRECVIPDGFPVKDFSNFITLSNKWTLSPVAFLTGGSTTSGSLSSATWGFDGVEWICLNDRDIPALAGATLIPYYSFRPTTVGTYDQYGVWMLVGGRMADGSSNRIVYITYDNGVNWRRGSSLMQLPDAIPAMEGCDNIVMDSQKNANISNNWKIAFRSSRTRVDYNVDGEVVYWQCPYIYLIGGYGNNGQLYNTIWRGVLSRLTFVPII